MVDNEVCLLTISALRCDGNVPVDLRVVGGVSYDVT